MQNTRSTAHRQPQAESQAPFLDPVLTRAADESSTPQFPTPTPIRRAGGPLLASNDATSPDSGLNSPAPDDSSSSARGKRKRHAISDAQRLSLRKKRKEDPTISQSALVAWFINEHGRHITQGQVSDILSSKWERLDSLDESATDLSSSFRAAEPHFPDLESALFDWQTRQTSTFARQASFQDGSPSVPTEKVTGDMLKAQAAKLWDLMPQHRDKPRPAFSNGWLEGYKRRRGLKSVAHRSTPATPNANSTTAAGASSLGGPKPAYIAQPGSALHVDRDLYLRIAAAPRTLTRTVEIPPRSGKAWRAPAGSIVRLSTPHGAQVGDLNLWHASNPRERFWAARTRQLHASHVGMFDRLWSSLPYLRPLATIVGDSLGARYGVDEYGGRVHDLLGTRCDPYVNALLSGTSYDFHCHSNLVRSVAPFGLDERDVHDVLNVFQVTGLTRDKSQYWMGRCPATSEDYFEFFAETDLLCALSACPGGDLSVWGFDGEAGRRMKESCRGLRAEVFEIQPGARLELLRNWREPKMAFDVYQGRHGQKIPLGEDDRCLHKPDDEVDDEECDEERDGGE